jgi:NitT/TauT family transport system substrate-binding protein
MRTFATFVVMLFLVVGCGTPAPEDTPAPPFEGTVEPAGEQAGGESSGGAPAAATGKLPAFTLDTSEYPSWSTFVVAGAAGLVNPDKGGEYGPAETKWGVDVVIQAKDYDPCLSEFANGACDAVCMTNMDSLNPAMGRPCTAICPTSNSVGADKVIGVGIADIAGLKDVKVFGLDKSVSRLTFHRGLEKSGENPTEFQFANLDPGAAATALQNGSGEVKAICVWNPFAMQTLRKTPNAKEIFSSALIPGEIIDQIVIGNDSLKKPGGEAFAACLCDIFYTVCNNLWSSDMNVQNATREALKADFAPKLSLDDMQVILDETKFFATAETGMAVYSSPEFQANMATVVKTCQAIEILEAGKQPTISYGGKPAQLTFTTKFMEQAASK